MPEVLRRAALVCAMLALAACSDTSRDPTTPAAHDKPDFTTLFLDPTVWDMAVVEAEYGSNYSLDSSPEGQALPPYIESDQLAGYDAVVCRDHRSSAHVWWDSPNDKGLVGFHVNPPLRFHGYTGSFTDRRGLRWRKAVYSTSQASEGQDNAGNVWRFKGQVQRPVPHGPDAVGAGTGRRPTCIPDRRHPTNPNSCSGRTAAAAGAGTGRHSSTTRTMTRTTPTDRRKTAATPAAGVAGILAGAAAASRCTFTSK